MRIFLTTAGLFLAAFVIHLVVWKIRLPKRHTPTLLVIFAMVFFLWTALMGHSAGVWVFLHIALYYLSVSFCYVILYSALEADSPTLSLMRFVAEASADGRGEDQVAAFLEKRPFVRARLSALVRSGLVREQAGRYVAAGAAPLAFRVLLGYRKVYGSIPKGG